jgi:hypothetical protein
MLTVTVEIEGGCCQNVSVLDDNNNPIENFALIIDDKDAEPIDRNFEWPDDYEEYIQYSSPGTSYDDWVNEGRPQEAH